MRPLTPEQTKTLLDAVRGDRLEALYVLAVPGLRQGELFGLKWETWTWTPARSRSGAP